MSFLKSVPALCRCSQLNGALKPRDIQQRGSESPTYLFLYRFGHADELLSIANQSMVSNEFTNKNSAWINALGCVSSDYKTPNSSTAYEICKHHNLEKRIKALSPKIIFCEEEALFSIVGSTKMRIQDFFNTKVFKPYFFSSEFMAWIFPISAFEKWIGIPRRGEPYQEFSNFHKYFFQQQLVLAKKIIEEGLEIPEIKIPETVVLEEPNGVLKQYIGRGTRVSFDIETTALSPSMGKIFCCTMSFDGNVGYYFDFDKVDKQILSDFLATNYIIGANFKFDRSWLKYHGVPGAKFDSDVNYLAHFAYSDRRNSLKANTWYHTNFGGYDRQLDIIKKKYRIKDYSDIPRDVMLSYAGIDAAVTFQLDTILRKYLNEAQTKLFDEMYVPYSNLISDVELTGIPIDLDYITKYREECLFRMKEIEDLIHKDPKFKDVNLKSSDQLGDMFQKLGAKNYGENSREHYLVQEEQVASWVEDGIPYAKEVLEYKELSKLVSSYLDPDAEKGLVKNTWSDGRVHGSFNLQATVVSRLSINSPALQTLPLGTNEKFRAIFNTKSDKYVFAEVDYAAFHLRLMALYSKDPLLVDIYKVGSTTQADMHSLTASRILTDDSVEAFVNKMTEGSDEEKKHYKALRAVGKIINFSLIYRSKASTFTRTVLQVAQSAGGWSIGKIVDYIDKNNLHELYQQIYENSSRKGKISFDTELYFKYLTVGTDIRNKFFETYKGVKKWGDNQIEFVKKHGYLENLLGFKMYVPPALYPLYENDGATEASVETTASNYPIISLEANILSAAMVRIERRLRSSGLKSQQVLNIHDAVLFHAPVEELPELKEIVQSELERQEPWYDGIAMRTEGSYSRVWKGNKDYPVNRWF